MTSIDLRSVAPDELRAAADVMRAALLFPPVTDDEWAKAEPSWAESHSVAAWDGTRCVGHAGALAVDTTVPGGARLATSAVTRVGVLPTHTRRGVLSGLLGRLLSEARERGQVLSSLRASEAVIYERFGFGLGGEACEVEVDVRRATLRSSAGARQCRLLDRAEILDVLPAVYERARTRVGAISRTPAMWRRYLGSALEGDKAGHVVVHEGADGLDGFAHYDLAWDETPASWPHGKAELHDLWGADASVETALWAFVLGVDLVTSLRAAARPVDDLLPWLLVDRRAYTVRHRWDEQWVRLLDTDAALTARAYGPGPAVTIAVRDVQLAANTGTFRVSGEGAERTSAAAEDRADLAVDAATLGAAYLGGTSWTQLAGSGRVTVNRGGAVADADALFASHPQPFCGSFF